MLAVHWTPVNNTKKILKNGISKSKNGLYCFPLTGHKTLDKWWVNFFNQCTARSRKKYNGIVFRIKEEDMPAYFGHWIGATTKCNFEKEISSVKQLQLEFRDAIKWRLGEEIARANNLDNNIYDWKEIDKLYKDLSEKAIQSNPKTIIDKLNDLDFMGYTLDDYQIVLSNSISAKRIIKILPQGNEFGRVLRKQKINKYNR